jgi:anti-sigma factor RsiW
MASFRQTPPARRGRLASFRQSRPGGTRPADLVTPRLPAYPSAAVASFCQTQPARRGRLASFCQTQPARRGRLASFRQFRPGGTRPADLVTPRLPAYPSAAVASFCQTRPARRGRLASFCQTQPARRGRLASFRQSRPGGTGPVDLVTPGLPAYLSAAVASFCQTQPARRGRLASFRRVPRLTLRQPWLRFVRPSRLAAAGWLRFAAWLRRGAGRLSGYHSMACAAAVRIAAGGRTGSRGSGRRRR